MLKSTRRNVGRGLLWTVIAAGGFAIVFGVVNGAFRESLLDGLAILALAVGYGLLISAWFVVPIGLGLGLLFPRLVAGRPPASALLVGAAVGIGVGVLVAACLKLMMPLSSFVGIATLSVPYCLIAGSVIALRTRSGVEVTAA